MPAAAADQMSDPLPPSFGRPLDEQGMDSAAALRPALFPQLSAELVLSEGSAGMMTTMMMIMMIIVVLMMMMMLIVLLSGGAMATCFALQLRIEQHAEQLRLRYIYCG